MQVNPCAEFRSQHRIIIIGAGLVGLALSISLKKAGYEVTCFDGDTVLKEVGAGIVLPPNSTRVLSSLGLLPAITARSSAAGHWVSHSYKAEPNPDCKFGVGDASPLAALSFQPDMIERYGSPFLVVHRADLRRILYTHALEAGVDVQLGCKVDVSKSNFGSGDICVIRKHIPSSPSSASSSPAASEAGSDAEDEQIEFHPASLVVACDGQASPARQFLAQGTIKPEWTGYIVTRVLMPVTKMHELGMSELISPPSVHIWQGPHTLATGYRLKDLFYLALSTKVPEEDRDKVQQELFRGPRPISSEELAKSYPDPWDKRVQTLLRHGEGFLKWMLLDFHADEELPKTWVHDREDEKCAMVLAGDAAHAIRPFIGSGAALGFEDASLLSNLLASCTETASIRRALHLFEASRRPRTRIVRNMTDRMGDMWMLPNGDKQVDRDARYVRGADGFAPGESRAMEKDYDGSRGFPMVLHDPEIQPWLYGWDGEVEARRCWDEENAKGSVS